LDFPTGALQFSAMREPVPSAGALLKFDSPDGWRGHAGRAGADERHHPAIRTALPTI
jgi:hypothetical protein